MTTPLSHTQGEADQWRSLFFTSTVGVMIAAPLVALLPPRRLDLQTFGLGIAWFMSAGYVVEEKTGKGLLWQIGSRIPSAGNTRRLKEEEEEKRERGRVLEVLRERGRDARDAELLSTSSTRGAPAATTEDSPSSKDGGEERRGVWKSVWMGREGDDWVEKRMKEEREALDDGRGYGGLIMDQLREVWGGGKSGNEEGEKKKDGARAEADDGKGKGGG